MVVFFSRIGITQRITCIAVLVMLLSSCSTMLTKDGIYQVRKDRSYTQDKMWGCVFSGTKQSIEFWREWKQLVDLKGEGVFIKYFVVTGWGIVLLVDTPLSVIVDVIFVPADLVHKVIMPDRVREICSKPWEQVVLESRKEK